MTIQSDIDQKNSQFWDELCGSQLARSRGISGRDPEALKIFDQVYLDLYPYLLDYVPVQDFSEAKVLESGLGYGTLSQQIAQHCAEYRGLDIAAGPVNMVNQRLAMLPGERGGAVQGSMLDCPFPDQTFDAVVSIGCFHHTGNLQRCIDETYRVLKPGGCAYVMVYNKYSYRNWMRWPVRTLISLLAAGRTNLVTASERVAYDKNAQGHGAPETVFTSIAELRTMFGRYDTFDALKQNWGGPLRGITLNTVGPLMGLDIYVTACK